jgi:hypothetical protein
MIEDPLGKGSISPPEHHKAIGRSTQEVIARRIEVYIPDSLRVIAILSQEHLQSETPKLHLSIHSPSKQIELIRRK